MPARGVAVDQEFARRLNVPGWLGLTDRRVRGAPEQTAP